MFSPTPKLRDLHYLYLTKVTGRVVAHCLDLDIVTAANHIDEAEKRLNALVTVQIEDALGTGNYAALNTPAPRIYWTIFTETFRSGKVRKSNNPVLSFKIPAIVPMEQERSSLGVLAAMTAAT